MKKSIGVIEMDHFFLRWLIERLPAAPKEAERKDELRDGLEELDEGRLESLVLQTSSDSNAVRRDGGLHIGDLSIWKSSRKVVMDGKEVMLTPKEFDILWFLAENRGEVMTKEQIYSAVWDGAYLLDEGNIMAFIRKLRKKIEPDPDSPIYILTVWGIGYKFTDRFDR